MTKLPLPETQQPESQGALSQSDGPLTPEAPARLRRPAGRRFQRVKTLTVGDSLTKQSFKKECDINNIMRTYRETGQITHISQKHPVYGDLIAASDFHTNQNKIIAAQEAFNEIPSEIRAEFDNDPALFLEFAQNPENIEEMREMGLAPPAKKETPSYTSDSVIDADHPAPVPIPAGTPAPAAPPLSPELAELHRQAKIPSAEQTAQMRAQSKNYGV